MKREILFFLLITLLPFNLIFAQTTDELKAKIDEKNNQIKQIEEEIRQYNLEVNNASKEAKTLQSLIKTLELTKRKLTTDIKLTESKISKTNLTILELDSGIKDTKENIILNKKAIISALKKLNSNDNVSITIQFLMNKNIGEIWTDFDQISQVNNIVRQKSKELSNLKLKMEEKQSLLGSQKSNLLGLKKDLSGKKMAVEYTAREKNSVLSETKSKEQAFKQLVKSKEELKAQFEKEVYDFESELNIYIDKGSYPAPKNNIFSWPLDDVYITQRFGKTVGAEKLYASGSHNGIDFRAQIGSPVKSVLSGTVAGTGNTDLFSGCYSFGKWVMIKHNNGLSTIYGHLSSINVSKDEKVLNGDVLGYSGSSGYSTGPHLHLGLYATQGVRIEKFVTSKGCKQAILPLADTKAYLDPLAYLPTI